MQMHVVQEFSLIQQRPNGNKQTETYLKELHVCNGLDRMIFLLELSLSITLYRLR